MKIMKTMKESSKFVHDRPVTYKELVDFVVHKIGEEMKEREIDLLVSYLFGVSLYSRQNNKLESMYVKPVMPEYAMTYRLLLMMEKDNLQAEKIFEFEGVLPIIRYISFNQLWEVVKDMKVFEIHKGIHLIDMYQQVNNSSVKVKQKGRAKKMSKHMLIKILSGRVFNQPNSKSRSHLISMLYYLLTYLPKGKREKYFDRFIDECVNTEMQARLGISLSENILFSYLIGRRYISWRIDKEKSFAVMSENGAGLACLGVDIKTPSVTLSSAEKDAGPNQLRSPLNVTVS